MADQGETDRAPADLITNLVNTELVSVPAPAISGQGRLFEIFQIKAAEHQPGIGPNISAFVQAT